MKILRAGVITPDFADALNKLAAQNSKVRIRQKYKRKYVKNPISGHEWPEDTLLNKWEIVGPTGVCDTANSYEEAEKKSKDWEAFYSKHGPV